MTTLVGYTHTAEGAAALRHALSLAELTNHEVALFPLFDLNGETWPSTELTTNLQGKARFLQPRANSPRAAEELIDLSNELDAQLIVIGVRSRSRVGKMLMGSDAQAVILGASVPVLSVKAGDHEH
ncbi:universal stress protein [Arthrobacter sp. NIO-1057]|uniref:universal stress protein n=1 Tax=Arthrobacter sp. NIO-1057 TaxID=993071 RepID=UPI000817C8C3|nr:universal stress protein [Arthrobacter sp. NIO-1057]SCC52993.1 Universal stress protein family protein [Arthrobacter sp. NIO-1057]